MAVQRIHPLEKNAEKILLGVTLVILLGVLAWQIRFVNNRVTVGKEEVPVARAYEVVASRAETLRAQVSDESPELPEAKPVDVRAAFVGGLEGAVSPSPSLAWGLRALPELGIGSVAGGGIKSGQFVPVPSVPGPGGLRAAAYLMTISAAEIEQNPGLERLLPAEGPHDKALVSVEAHVDAEALRAALTATPQGGEEDWQPLPQPWWERSEVVRVSAERQERQADGSWGAAAAVGELPGRVTGLAELAATPELDIGELRQQAAGKREEVLRPALYQRAELRGRQVGLPWVPPSDTGAGLELAEELRQLRRERTALDRRIKGLEAALEPPPQQQPPREPPPRGGRGRDGGGGRGGRGGGGGGGGDRGGEGGAPDPNRPDERQLTLERIRKDLTTNREQLGRVDTRIGEIEAQLGGAAPLDAPDGPATGAQFAPLLEGQTTMWVHDLSVERGREYRYRVRYALTNPVYGRSGLLRQEDRQSASEPELWTAWSEWSEPVRVEPEVYYFLTQASTGGLQGAVASVEVYAFRWGYWRRGTADLQPGDRVHGQIEFPDVAGEGARDVAQQGAGGAAEPERVRSKAEEVFRDTYLLLVTNVPSSAAGIGAGADRVQAYFRDVDGKVLLERAAGESMRELRTRLENSHADGQRDLRGEQRPRRPVPPGGPPGDGGRQGGRQG